LAPSGRVPWTKKISVALPEFIHSSPSIPNRQTPTTDHSTNYRHTKTIVPTAAHHPLRHCPLGPDWRRPQTTRTYGPLYSSSICLGQQDSLLYTQFSCTHPSSISSSRVCSLREK
jgi:hypothetical protein